MSLHYNKSIFEKCIQIKTVGFIKNVWTDNGIINFKMSENPNEPPKKMTTRAKK